MSTAVGSTLSIDRISIVEYFTSGPTPLPRQMRAPVNFLVFVTASVNGAQKVGVGECVVRPGTGAEREHSWATVTQACDELLSSPLPDGSLDDLDVRIRAGVQSALEAAAHDLVPQPTRGNLRRIAFAVESALLQALDSGPALDRRTSTRRAVPVARIQSSTTARRSKGSSDQRHPSATQSVTYLTSTGDLRSDRTALAALKPVRAGTCIIELPDTDDWDSLQAHVAEIARHARKHPRTTYVLDSPARMRDLKNIRSLQAIADRAYRRPFVRRQSNVHLMVGYGVRSRAQVERIINKGVRALKLRIDHVGSIASVRELAEHARQQLPTLFLSTSSSRGGSAVNTSSGVALSERISGVDAHIPDVDPVPAGLPSTTDESRSAAALFEALIPLAGRYHFTNGRADDRGSTSARNTYPNEMPSQKFGLDAMRSSLVAREAIAQGFETTRYSPNVFTAHRPTETPLIFGSSARSPVSTHTAYVISDSHKGAAQGFLERAGVPVPSGRIFHITDRDDAVEYAQHAGYPLVTKPASGTGGTGVTLNIRSDEQLLAGFDKIAQYPRHAQGDVLVQQHLPGDIYRVIVADGRVLAAVRRERPVVVGDGQRSIAELIIDKNSSRRFNPRLRRASITVDASRSFLSGSDHTLADAPAPGEHVYLGTNADGATWGDSIDVSEELHPSIAAAMAKAVAAVPGLNFCGVDVLIEDHRLPLDQQSVGVCELNSCPELTTPEFPVYGRSAGSTRTLFRLAAQRHHVDLAEPMPQVDIRVRVTGISHLDRYVRWFCVQAEEMEVSGHIERTGDDRVLARLAGDLVAVTSLSCLAIAGPIGSSAEKVETAPAHGGDVPRGFQLVEGRST